MNKDVDGRDIGERSDAVLRTAMPGHDEILDSLLADARRLRDRAPLRGFAHDEIAEILRRAGRRLRTDAREGLPDLGRPQALIDRRIEPLDDRRRRTGRSHDAGPEGQDEI